MNVQSRMSDIQGLTKVAPVSRRLFVTASAATAAGYTLAAGPVGADAIKTDTAGITVGEAKVKVRAARCRSISPSLPASPIRR